MGKKKYLGANPRRCPPPPPAGNPAVYLAVPRAGERLFKITLAETDAKSIDNKELFQKAGTVKW